MKSDYSVLINVNNLSNLDGPFSCIAKKFDDITFDGRKRIYLEDLDDRDYSLEFSYPYMLYFDIFEFDEHSWGTLLCKVADVLLKMYPEMYSKIFDFRCEWTKAAIFSKEPRTNFKILEAGFYLNVNHTALHSCWLLQDLFDLFGVDKSQVVFFIHRAPAAERKEVVEYVDDIMKKYFVSFLRLHHKKSKEYATEKVIPVIEKYLNPLFKNVSKAYYSLFLIDDLSILTEYSKQVRSKFESDYRYDAKAKMVLNKYLDYYLEFYKHLKPYYVL